MVEELRASYEELRRGLERHAAYSFVEDAEGLTVFYEPYHTEGHAYGDDLERLFLRFRRDGDELEFVSLDVEARDGGHAIDVAAAKEPLRVWLDYLLKP